MSRSRILTIAVVFIIFTGATLGLLRNRSLAEESRAPDFVLTVTDSVVAREYSLGANDLAYNRADNRIYLSIRGDAPRMGNSIVPVDLNTWQVGNSVFVGSEPTRVVVSADGDQVYTVLEGSASVARVDVTSGNIIQRFPIGVENGYRLSAVDIAVSPEDRNVLAVGRIEKGNRTAEKGVVIFENGVQRPRIARANGYGTAYLTFGAGSSELFGSGYRSSFVRMAVDSAGVKTIGSADGSGMGRIKFQDGRILDSNGILRDAESGRDLGMIAASNPSRLEIDLPNQRLYSVRFMGLTYKITAYNSETFQEVGSVSVPGQSGDAVNLQRWGSNGFAFTTANGSLFVVQTTLIPNGEPVPLPTATPLPSPSVSPSFRTSVSTLPLFVNRMESSADGAVFASVPSIHGTYGNRLVKIDASNASIEGSVFVGSEPGRISLSPDGSTAYVILDGARAIRKVRTADLAALEEIRVGGRDFSGPFAPGSISVSPEANDKIIVGETTTINSRILVLETGVERQLEGVFANEVLFSEDPGLIFGNDIRDRVFIRLAVEPDRSVTVRESPFDGGWIKYRGGKIYASSGLVLDPQTLNLEGTFNTAEIGRNWNEFTIDEERRRAFFVGSSPGECVVQAHDLDTFVKIGTIRFPCLSNRVSIQRWGTDGLLIGRDAEPMLVIRSTLVDPDSTVVPSTPTPTPSPTQTPSPLMLERSLRLATSDIEFNQSDGRLYASVPSGAGDGFDNRILALNPFNLQIAASYAVGTNPGKIAISDDSEMLWSTVNSGTAIRPIVLETGTMGTISPLQVRFGFTASELAIVPGTRDRIVVIAGSDVRAYDNGILLPDYPLEPGTSFPMGIRRMAFDPSTLILYGTDGNSGNVLQTALPTAGGLRGRSADNGFMDSAFVIGNGKLYSAKGLVVDPVRLVWEGRFNVSANSVAVSSEVGRAYFLTNNSIEIFDVHTYLKLGSLPLGNYGGTAGDLLVLPEGRLAFRISNSSGSYVKVFQSPLIDPRITLPAGIEFESVARVVSESSGIVSISIKRTGAIDSASTADVEIVPGSATLGEDFDGTPRSISFGPGDTSATFEVAVNNDEIWEPTESFRLRLRDPSGAILLDNSEIEIRITESGPEPKIRLYPVVGVEGAPGEQTVERFEFVLSRKSTLPVSVDYVVSGGSALPNVDFIPLNGTLTVPAGQTVGSVAVTILGDSVVEPNELFWITARNPVNASLENSAGSATIVDRSRLETTRSFLDFDGDGDTDTAVYRPFTNSYHLDGSISRASRTFTFGLPTDVFVPAEYSGDLRTDLAVFRPETGEWFVLRSQDSTYFSVKFGLPGDIPVGADFDGDLRADFAVFRPSEGTWYVQGTTVGYSTVRFGVDGDIPAVADYDGDGKSDIAVWRRVAGEWWYLRSSDGEAVATSFGLATDKIIPGDYTGDGRADLAIFRPAEKKIIVRRSDNSVEIEYPFPEPSESVVPGDFDGDGRFDPSVVRRFYGVMVHDVYFSTGNFSSMFLGVESGVLVPTLVVR